MDEFGNNDVLQLKDIDQPEVSVDTVLVKVKAVGVNPVDWKIVRGYLAGAFPSHFPMVPGWDFSGVVEEVGPSITEFKVGDEVFGYDREDHVQNGTLAEVISVPVRCLWKKPASLSFEEAGALPLAGLTALQMLDAVSVSEGDTVLIHNGSGGVGCFAIQIAKARGARVIASASKRNFDFVTSLGAEPVEYGDQLGESVKALASDGVDAVIDPIGGDALAASPALVKDATRIASVVDGAGVLKLGGRYVFVRPIADDLRRLAELADAGDLKVPIEKSFPLDRTADAYALSEDGHVTGKIVITI